MTAALEFNGVTRTFGDVTALDDVSFRVERGELVAIMGPSGSGKSTLLSLAGALDEPTRGTVHVRGTSLASCSARERARLRRRDLGFVFQDHNLVPGLTALENVALPLELDGTSLDEAHRHAHEALAAVELDTLADRFPDELSGGERQRVAIARAFVGPRELLLADEPTGALNTLIGEQVMRLLRGQCEAGKAAVVVTHDASHAAWADRVLTLRDGRFSTSTPASARA